MFGLFRKQQAAATRIKARQSIFSTDARAEPLSALDVSEVMRLSFQKTPADFKPMKADGTAAKIKRPKATYAMDSFAMDAPSEGNPLAMKPFALAANDIPFTQLYWYAAQGFIGYQVMGMIAQNWFVSKACTMPARDAIRHGYDISPADDGDDDAESDGADEKQLGKILKYIKKQDKKFKIKQNCVEAVRLKNIFGIRIVMFIIETDDMNFYEQPFNIDGIKPKSYKGISQIDPYWVTPEMDFPSSSNPAAINFYEPTWWRVNGKRIHRSHLVVLRGDEVIDILKPSYLWGGLSVPQKIAERVYAAERTANEAPQLAMTKRMTTWKMDLTQAMANQEAMQAKMSFVSQNRDNYGFLAIGLEDEVEQHDITLNDFDETISKQYLIASAAAEVPYVRMMEDSPAGGLNSSGDYEADSYHERLEAIQENDMQPILDRHYQLLIRAWVKPKYGIEFEAEVSWNPVDSPNAKEQADINKTNADTAVAYSGIGAIDGTDVRQKLIDDKDSGYNMLEPIVDGGPGDRDAEQERRDQELEAQNNPPEKGAKDSKAKKPKGA